MYDSVLFRSMRRYAEKSADDWFILSAKHHVLRHDKEIEPYEQTLNTMNKGERMAWAARVKEQLVEMLPTDATVIMLAGLSYREFIVPFLEDRGIPFEVSMRGMPIGRQLEWLKAQTR